MKFPFLKYLSILFLASALLLSACKSSKPGFGNSSATTSETAASPNTNSTNPGAAPAEAKPTKTLAQPAQKLVYDSTKVSFKIKQKTKVETFKDDDDDDDDDDKEITVIKSESTKKHRSHAEEEKLEKWLSGSFLASGIALLLTSLVLVIIGSGPAGLLAIIGGALFLTGFILTLVELLGD